MLGATNFRRVNALRLANNLPRFFSVLDQSLLSPSLRRISIPGSRFGGAITSRRWLQKSDQQSNICGSVKCNTLLNRQSKDSGTIKKDSSRTSLSESLSQDQNEIFDSSKTKNNSTVSWTTRTLRRTASALISAMGFVSSSVSALLKDSGQIQSRWRPSVESLREFLKTSAIDTELLKSLNVRLIDNIIILAIVQRRLLGEKDRRDEALLATTDSIELPSKEESLRYVHYATAAYGDSMISAAELDVLGKWSRRFTPATKARISEHIDVPEDDIVLMDINFSGDGKYLRHFVALDHAHKKIVLAIRGTFSLSEVVVDVAAFSRPFCGGEAPSEMATMAERVWEIAGAKIQELLKSHEDYELILTGHSLGAGAACLLNVLCHRNEKELINGRKIRCFAYAAPPCYTPLEELDESVKSCINHVNMDDVIPFMSMDSVRHFFASLRAVAEVDLGYWNRLRLVTGLIEPNEELLNAVDRASKKRLSPKPGAPLLMVPAAASLWMREKKDSSGMYDVKICDSKKLATSGVLLHIFMMRDHFPPSYEHALHNLE